MPALDIVTLQAQILSLRSAVDASLSAGLDEHQPPTTQQRWAAGEQLLARVETALSGSRFHVRVDNLLLEMKLPAGFEPGDRLELEFVSNQPRPSFLLKNGPEATLRQNVELSPAARSLGEVLKSVLSAGSRSEGTLAAERSAVSVPIKAAVPVLPAPSLDVARLAQALSTALGSSGLFYESHQSEWVLGQRPLEALLSEPQGRLPAAGRDIQPSLVAASMNKEADAAALLDKRAENITSPVPQDAKSAALPVHPDALPHVRSQLNALEAQQLVWQGQLWPGQQLEWRIQEPGEQDPSSDEAQPWFTQLRLRFPRLGDLTADLALVGRSLRVRLVAGEPDAQAVMNGARIALADSLAASGIDLVSFKVTSHGD